MRHSVSAKLKRKPYGGRVAIRTRGAALPVRLAVDGNFVFAACCNSACTGSVAKNDCGADVSWAGTRVTDCDACGSHSADHSSPAGPITARATELLACTRVPERSTARHNVATSPQ